MGAVEGLARFGDYRTWYRVTGDLAGATPLIVAHGGPGCTHDYVDSFKALSEAGRAVIHYDQIGNGRSTRLPEEGAEFWTVDLFLDELRNLIDHLGIGERYYLLGQSWGGMMGAEFAISRPEGLKALILADSPASMPLWIEETGRLRAALPADVQAVLSHHEAANSTTHPDYVEATKVFNLRHVCRLDPAPAAVQRTHNAMDEDSHVYNLMIGPNEFHITGTLKDWTAIDRLRLVDVPTLLISGAYDEATPATVRPFAEHIPDVRWHIFPNSSHMPHVEEFDDCMKLVGDFLLECDKK
ncbi:proline iminopeptidase-family hydrolase [Rhizobium sp. KVB221]|uniref:Proline iminopeptidase-family hydrolase n=1 Tax=Rhizobium setariae TaxID=2801340 RepID=A0A936YTS6_9HYPH|nr:proline iminopeptidase-family hydrolase [Rhizobium setariae]MBL0374314.1 proline iminopeptidase-family hydrolase [Rhizobium setariae]